MMCVLQSLFLFSFVKVLVHTPPLCTLCLVVYACDLSLSLSVYVGCITGRSRPDSARGVHRAVTQRDREESKVAVRRPF